MCLEWCLLTAPVIPLALEAYPFLGALSTSNPTQDKSLRTAFFRIGHRGARKRENRSDQLNDLGCHQERLLIFIWLPGILVKVPKFDLSHFVVRIRHKH